MPKRYIHKNSLPPTNCESPKPKSTTARINIVSSPFTIISVLVRTYMAATARPMPISTPYTICANITYGTFIRLSPLRIYIPITVSI